jgi:hypothetical protein
MSNRPELKFRNEHDVIMFDKLIITALQCYGNSGALGGGEVEAERAVNLAKMVYKLRDEVLYG